MRKQRGKNQYKPKISRIKYIVKVREKSIGMEHQKTIGKTQQSKILLFEKISKIDKLNPGQSSHKQTKEETKLQISELKY